MAVRRRECVIIRSISRVIADFLEEGSCSDFNVADSGGLPLALTVL